MAAKVDGTPLQTAYSFSFLQRKGRHTSVATDKPSEYSTATAATAAAATSAVTTGSGQEKSTTVGTSNGYESNVKVIAIVKTVEDFWSVYNYLVRPNKSSQTTDYHFFRAGIKPTWEDPYNEKGGKWIIRLPKGLASRYWEEVLLAFVGGQFQVPEGEVCGLVISIRAKDDILGIWTKNANDKDNIERLRESIRKVLPDFPIFAYHSMEYRPHNQSMADRLSLRSPHHGHGGHHGGASKPHLTGGTGNPAGTWSKQRSGSWGER
eukprot:CAMPEP_0113460622 /NCGR_PEP_ID=MMETSP0014_2-20120614/11092_1 /TAXON_ID=2857 /ORGANISM="Nitzschia sp." /LENGTH=263 /DNA_ID=CAMNT_0000352301 /DNA_START=75 /DNA_END=866 /DNA_ORIENTATION=+ /assembly_acc=CAM_ASM_000159